MNKNATYKCLGIINKDNSQPLFIYIYYIFNIYK